MRGEDTYLTSSLIGCHQVQKWIICLGVYRGWSTHISSMCDINIYCTNSSAFDRQFGNICVKIKLEYLHHMLFFLGIETCTEIRIVDFALLISFGGKLANYTPEQHIGYDSWNINVIIYTCSISISMVTGIYSTWWRHQMETFSALLAICAGNSPVPGEFPTQRPVTRSFDVFFDLRLNKRLSKQSWGWWFETPSWSLWRQCNEMLEWLLMSWYSMYTL